MKRLLAIPWFGPLLALLVVYALFAVLRPETFLGTANLITMTRQTTVVAIAAVGMTLVIMLGGIDLSVGSIVALTTVVTAGALRSGSGAFGAARLGLIAATKANFKSICTPPKIAKTVKPEARAREAYEIAYDRYVEIYPAIREI